MTGEIRKEINSAIDKRVRSNVKAWLCVCGWMDHRCALDNKKKKKGKKEEWEGKRQSTCRFGRYGGCRSATTEKSFLVLTSGRFWYPDRG